MQHEPILSSRKTAIRDLANDVATNRANWIEKNAFFYKEDYRYMRFLVPEGLRVLELGCGTGQLLAELKPSHGVGVDFSQNMVNVAKVSYPHLDFNIGDIEDAEFMSTLVGPFDVIVLSDTIGSLEDCQATLSNLHRLCTSDTRIVIAYYSKVWEPLLALARGVGLKMPQEEQNALSTDDIANLLKLADFEVIKREWRQLIPRRLLGLGILVNRYLAPFPAIRRACLRNYVVARPLRGAEVRKPSTTVLIPCRNERGNIEDAVRRIPRFCEDMEIIFAEGHSKDGTLEEIQRVIAAYPHLDIKAVVQDGKGKGNAVRQGFERARGDILMILDADLTMPPEALPKFYEAIVSGKGEFINGSRLIYPMEKDAMRFLNYLANHTFSLLFTWLLNQRFTDTLCGTKVLSKKHYLKIAENRKYFGEFDPFGDFDLIFGAAKLNLKVVEIPITYANRKYGETQISRFEHGWLLLKMVIFAFRKLKAF
ncbi:putative Glycosyl transferase, family 2; putative Dolichyl-phosphate beta-D-mannosyltransferase [Sulfuricella denitrificans skB26]|uniref:Putative Glycosyl transferase, family 2 putative Dolichyl-phosphate beta-D-mannosyltransferase n=1 Tax=Sulfuricella denitrificans (strain DSM 22764 / NBRC 105220 / skB26) TaxID=1163617 RepID=S6ABE6_SULDS|nr:glycosyltransferase [Sulfuricella denitrificans]BAN36690.1 putative Glycosyl transferase, family 2; putative Dolichyl-phosphate beta-D-mannosyltransferase [Sulfuricella denitrificans skB26]